MTSISIATAAAITEKSSRTLWRRVSEGTLKSSKQDAQGRTLVDLDGILPEICIRLGAEDLQLLEHADAGDAAAQADMAALFLTAGKESAGLYWLRLAAKQDHPDAMQMLGHCHAAGRGVAQDDNLAIMWVAKAAALGHPVAVQQIRLMKPGRR